MKCHSLIFGLLALLSLIFTAPVSANAPAIHDPMAVLSRFFAPALEGLAWASWDVKSPSPIRWQTPGIIMDDDNQPYGFHRFGTINGWQVKQFGPRGGVEVVRLIPSKEAPFPTSIKPFLAQHSVTAVPQSCNAQGTLLKLTKPNKQPAYLYASQSQFIFFPLDEVPAPQALAVNGISGLRNIPGCRY